MLFFAPTFSVLFAFDCVSCASSYFLCYISFTKRTSIRECCLANVSLGGCTPCLPSLLLAVSPSPSCFAPDAPPPFWCALTLFGVLCRCTQRLSVSFRAWCTGRLAAEDALARMDDAVARTEEREGCLKSCFFCYLSIIFSRVIWPTKIDLNHLRRLYCS